MVTSIILTLYAAIRYECLNLLLFKLAFKLVDMSKAESDMNAALVDEKKESDSAEASEDERESMFGLASVLLPWAETSGFLQYWQWLARVRGSIPIFFNVLKRSFWCFRSTQSSSSW